MPELGSAGARQSAVLHELTLGARFHHRRGWFARWETRRCRQTRSDGGRDLLGPVLEDQSRGWVGGRRNDGLKWRQDC